MAEQPTQYREGQMATDPKTGQRVVFQGGIWVKTDPAVRPRATTTEQDRKSLEEASGSARIERDVMRTYDDAEKAITAFDTGPAKSFWMDAITPDEDDGIFGTIAANTIGLAARPLVDPKTFAARDHLKTVNARTSLAASAQLKGVASDRDMGLLRLTGIKDSKTVGENRRIIEEARINSALEQYRAKQKARWISNYGSLSAPAPSGRSFEEVSQHGEQVFVDTYRQGQARAAQGGKKRPPAAPPSKRRATTTIDLNGNPVR
jgi:hypothetical protein